MLKILQARFTQGHRTSRYPDEAPTLPERFRGRPVLDRARCKEGCTACADACPTAAITQVPQNGSPGGLDLDLGRCLFCTECTAACPTGAIGFTRDPALSASKRADLHLHDGAEPRVDALAGTMRRLFGRSLKLRQVSAGGCNACEADLNVLGTIVFDLGRFGVQFVASPRHADGLVITGPVTENMKAALLATYEAVPPPKLVIAVGACAISGGPFAGHPEANDGAAGIVPVDLFIPGCPPHPFTILDGLLRLLGRIEHTSRLTVASAPEPETQLAREATSEQLRWGVPRAEEANRYLGVTRGKDGGER